MPLPRRYRRQSKVAKRIVSIAAADPETPKSDDLLEESWTGSLAPYRRLHIRRRRRPTPPREDGFDIGDKSFLEGMALVLDDKSWVRSACGLKIISKSIRESCNDVFENLETLITQIEKHISSPM